MTKQKVLVKLWPWYMDITIGGRSSQKRILTQEQKDKIEKAEKLSIKWSACQCFTEKELKELFNEQELREFYQFMNYQTVGYDKEKEIFYYYITDVIAFIKGLDPLD